MLTDLEYDGTRLHWPSNGKTYKATSGLPADPSKPADPDWRQSQYSCVKDHGPVPEGTYTFSTAVEAKKGLVHVSDWSTCTLSPGAPIQKIPRGADAQEPRAGGQNCEPYWANWGTNRVRLEPKDSKTRLACNPGRSGFYLHDSTKGYSHGCIEVEPRFFTDLYAFAKTSKGKRLSLGVIYRRQVTQGGTKVP
ncbi:MAG: DUF2778 domain-containing protein [Acidobacteria bacterium]|nr:DUF2778 domain-containing protein [Acidobacteriota bacterium]